MEEIWRDIEGFEDRYQVSNLGRVKSVDRTTESYSKLGEKYTSFFKGKVLKLKKSKRGYMTKGFELLNSRKRKYYLVHRLVAQAFIPNPENKLQVNHIDGNKANNKVENLEWCTRRENLIHAMDNDLLPKGEKHPKTNLTNRDVIGIKTHLKYGFSNATTAKIYEVKIHIVDSISAGTTFKHIKI